MRFFSLALLFFSFQLHAATPEVDGRDAYREVVLPAFVSDNQISKNMADKKQRLMLKPEPIKFDGVLKSKPRPGEFSLAYDALQLWQGAGELPNIDHSAFVGTEGGPVLGVYVTHEAASMLKGVQLDSPVTFYAMHIYNYAKGPRLVIVAASSIANH